jgi:hypothetical protein
MTMTYLHRHPRRCLVSAAGIRMHKALPGKADPLRRAVCGRHRDRPAGARTGTGGQRGDEAAGHRRQQARRQWLHRRQRSGARRAGRLHGPHRDQYHPCRGRAPVQKRALRPGQEFCADYGARQGRADHGGQHRLSRVQRQASSSRSQKRARARSASAAAVRRAGLRANCSSSWPTCSCCMCPTRAIPLPSPTCWAARSR